MYSLKSTHQLADLIELVYIEIPIDMHSTTQDVTKQIQRVLVSTYNINKLNASIFLTTTDKIKKTLIFILIRYIVFHIMEITQVEQDRLL